MPGLVVFRRRWSVGSDDLVVPGAFLLISHFICMIVVLLSILLFQYNTAILCVRLLFYHQIGYVLILFFSVCVETGICVISMRGSILDSDARSTINVWIYLKSMVIFFDITWLVLGTIWLSSYYPEAAVDEPKKIFLVIIICNWAVVMMTFTTIWCTFDTAGRSWVKMKKYQRSMRETESRFNYKRSNSMNRNWRQRKVMRAYQDSWDHRCRLLFCCMSSSERNRNSFTDIARLLSDFFRELDVVPSDVVAGLVLLRKFQRVEREAVVRQRKNGTYEFLSGVPITERTQFLALNDAKNFDFFQTVIHYMYFAQGAYGWPMYLLINRAKVWNLLPHLKCLGCCCRRSGDQAEVIKDNCCLCNYAALKKTLQVGDIEIIYATYHVDVGETPFFVAIDFTQKKVVVSIRGTLSMKDILTDLNAEGEVLPLQPPRDDWLGHKGMVQAAIYIRQKLTEEQLIEKALSYDTVRETQTFDLVLVGHSLGAGTAAILAILMKPDYPTLQCFSYSPPGGLLSMPAVEYSKSFITSVVLGKDVVPRIGLNQMEALRADLINAIQRSVDPKWKTISCSVICCCGCAPEPTSVVEMSSKDTHINQYQEERDSARTGSTHPNDSSIALTLHQPLYPPGRIIHVVRHHPKPEEQKYDNGWRNVLKSRDPVYQAIWADNKDFDQVLISPSMLQDHMPDAVLAALKKVVTTSGPRKPQRHVSNAFSSNDVSAGDFGDSDRLSLHSKTKDLVAQAQHSRSNSNFSNSIILTPTTQHKLCLETSFTNLQHTQQLAQHHAANSHQPHGSSMSKASSTVGSIFSRHQFDSLSCTQYDNISTSVMDESITTTIARRSPSDAGTVIVHETEPRLKTVAFDMEMIQMHDTMAMKSPSPQVPTRSILHRQSSARTTDKRPKVMPFTTLRRASDVQAGDSDWGGLAPLASPETLSEISSISSRTSVPHSLANSIERYLHKMNGGAPPENGQVGVPNRLEDIFESQLHTPKVMRRAPKFSENLAHCAEDTRNLDQYKRMGRVFITFPRIFPDYDERNRHRPSSSLDSDSDDSFESALSVEKAARELHRPVQQRRITLPSSPTPEPLHHAEAEHPLQQNKQTSKSADQLDDETTGQAAPATKKLTFSDSEILNDDCSSQHCPACPCHGAGASSKVDCCRRIDHSQCVASSQLLPSTSSVNTTGSVDTTYYSANSSLEQFITPARHADACTLRPGVLESHFPVYEKTVAAPEETPRRDVVGGRVRKRLSSEEFIFTRAEDYPLIVQIAERCSPQPGSLSRKRKGCVYPAGNRILLTPQKTAATTTTSTNTTPTRQHTATAASPRKFSNTNSESSV